MISYCAPRGGKIRRAESPNLKNELFYCPGLGKKADGGTIKTAIFFFSTFMRKPRPQVSVACSDDVFFYQIFGSMLMPQGLVA